MERYNGWANRNTWNVALWLDNDEAMYRACVAWTRGRAPVTAKQAREFVGVLMPSGTPDKCGLSRVRWSEIAAHLNEMRNG